MTVIPSLITSDERDELQEMHGICWNTDDTFDEENVAYSEIVSFHRQIATGGHWYLPNHAALKHERFATELEAYKAARRCGSKVN